MITRKLGKMILGKATPAQLMLACVLGAALGFMPGFINAPGLIVCLALFLIVLNANLALAVIVGAVAKGLSYLLLPVSFYLGIALLEGPIQPLFKAIINAPVLALFGFDYYATTGALVLGIIFGLLVGLVVVKGIRTLRSKMASLESGSEKYQQWAGKWWVKLLSFILLGKGKADFAAIAAAKGKVIRPIGAIAAVLVVAGLIVLDLFFAGPLVTYALKAGLQQANGATVDIGSAGVNLAKGKMTLHDLALADPNKLTTNLFQAKTLSIDIDTTDLLTKRITLDSVVAVNAAQGTTRKVPGKLIGKAPSPTTQTTKPTGQQKSVDDYLKNAKTWKDRLAQAKRWLDKLQSAKSVVPTSSKGKPARPSYTDLLAQQAAKLGYANVRAADLITRTPTFTVLKLTADGIQSTALPAETIDLHGANLSTQPVLLDQPAELSIKSSKDTLDAEVSLAGMNKGAAAGAMDTIKFAYRGLPVNQVASQIKFGSGKPPIAGGTMDLSIHGKFSPDALDLPLTVTIHHTTIHMPGGGMSKVDKLTLPIALAGPMDNPKVTISKQQLADALKQAGLNIVKSKVKGEASKQIKKATGKLGQNASKALGDKRGKLLNGLFGGNKKKDNGQ